MSDFWQKDEIIMNAAYVTSKGQLSFPRASAVGSASSPARASTLWKKASASSSSPSRVNTSAAFAASSNRSPARNPSCRSFLRNGALKRKRKIANEDHRVGCFRDAGLFSRRARRGENGTYVSCRLRSRQIHVHQRRQPVSYTH